MFGRSVAVAFRLPGYSRLPYALVNKNSVSTLPIRLYSNTARLRAVTHEPESAADSGHAKKSVGTSKRRAGNGKQKQVPTTKSRGRPKKSLTAEQKEAQQQKEKEKKEKAKLSEQKKKEKAKLSEQKKKEKAKLIASKKREKAKLIESKKREKAKLTESKKTDEKTEVQQLVTAALEPPPDRPRSSLNIFTHEHRKSLAAKGETVTRADVRERFVQRSREITAAWKNLGPAEIEHYNHRANEENATRAANFKRWVESHSPDEIREANLARQRLRKKYPTRKAEQSKWRNIKDERQVKKALNGYFRYMLERIASGDFRHIKSADRTKLIAQEWRDLGDSQKASYNTLYGRDKDRWKSEYNDTYGHLPSTSPRANQLSASAAAA